MTEPLHKLTRKNEVFHWGKEQEKAIGTLRDRMSKAETLGFLKPGRKTKLIKDASNTGLGAVLIQENNGKEKVISYASRTLTDVVKRYSTT